MDEASVDMSKCGSTGAQNARDDERIIAKVDSRILINRGNGIG